MTKKRNERTPAPVKKPAEKEKIIFLAVAVLIVVGTLIFYMASRETGPVRDVHDFTPMAEDPVAGPLLERFKNNPNDLETLVNLGNYYYDNTNFAMAEMFYRKALEIEPHDVNVMVDLGTALFYMERREEASQVYENALQIDPQHKNAMFNMGVVRDAMGDREGALAWWRRFIEVAGDDPHVEPIRKMIAEMEAEMEKGGSVE
jgi:cytochrome c-type biogenesis protein CcmH/NrfG